MPNPIYSPSSKNRPLSEFPSLFAMEFHTGFSGILFLIFWVFMVYWEHGQVLKEGDFAFWLYLIGLAGSGLVMVFLSFLAVTQSVKMVGRKDTDEGKNDEFLVRLFIALLSTGYVAWICFLIWLTGGASSPFTPFIVMVFTLTISKCRVPSPGFWVLGGFIFAIAVACLSGGPPENFISNDDLHRIQQSQTYDLLLIVFIMLSLVTPFVSQWILSVKE